MASELSELWEKAIRNFKRRNFSVSLDCLKSCSGQVNSDNFIRNNCFHYSAEFFRHIYGFIKDGDKKAFQSIQGVINLLVQHSTELFKSDCDLSSDAKSERLLFCKHIYHILVKVLDLNMTDDALIIATMFQTFSFKMLFPRKPDSEIGNYIHNIAAKLWNHAARIEKMKRNQHNVALQLRHCSVLLCIVHPSDFKAIVKKICVLTEQYMYYADLHGKHNFNKCMRNVAESVMELWVQLISAINLFHIEACDSSLLLHSLCNWIVQLSSVFLCGNSLELIVQSFSNCILNVFQSQKDCQGLDYELKTFFNILKYILSIFVVSEQSDICEVQEVVRLIENKLKHKSASNEAIIAIADVYFCTLLAFLKEAAVKEDYFKLVKDRFSTYVSLNNILIDFWTLKQTSKSGSTKRTFSVVFANMYLILKKHYADGTTTFFGGISITEAFVLKLLWLYSQSAEIRDYLGEEDFNLTVSAASHLGFLCAQKGLYQNAIKILHVAIMTSKDTWRCYEVLIKCYLQVSNFHAALYHLVKAMLLHGEKCDTAFKLWKKVKDNARKAGCYEIASKTIADVLKEKETQVSDNVLLNLLQQELVVYILDSEQYSEEIKALCVMLLPLCITNQSRANLFMELAKCPHLIPDMPGIEDRNAVKLCQKAIDMYSKELAAIGFHHRDRNLLKMKLSFAWFWLYFHSRAEKQSCNINNIAKKDSQVCKEEDNVTYALEVELFSSLHKAIDIWKDFRCDDKFWNDFKSCIKYKDNKNSILEYIHSMAEIFIAAMQYEHAFECLYLLEHAALKIEDSFYLSVATSSLVVIFTKLGYRMLAEVYIGRYEDINMGCNDPREEILSKTFACAKSYFMLKDLDENVYAEGMKLIPVIVEEDFLKKGYENCILNIEVTVVKFQYAQTAFDLANRDLESINSLFISLMKKMNQLQFLINKYKFPAGEQYFLYHDAIKTKLINLYLQLTLLITGHLANIGYVSKAEFHLTEALSISNGFIFPYWTSEILLSLCQLNLQKQKLPNCQKLLNQLDFILNSVLHSTEVNHSNSTRINTPTIVISDETLTAVNTDKMTMSVNTHETLLALNTDDTCTFPSLHDKMKVLHKTECKCINVCGILCTGYIYLKMNFLQCLLFIEKNSMLTSESKSQGADKIFHYLDLIQDKCAYLMKSLNIIKSIIGSAAPNNLHQFAKLGLDFTANANVDLLFSLTEEILFVKASLLCDMQKYEEAVKVIESATLLLNSSTSCSRSGNVSAISSALYPHLYAKLAYLDVTVFFNTHMHSASSDSVFNKIWSEAVSVLEECLLYKSVEDVAVGPEIVCKVPIDPSDTTSKLRSTESRLSALSFGCVHQNDAANSSINSVKNTSDVSSVSGKLKKIHNSASPVLNTLQTRRLRGRETKIKSLSVSDSVTNSVKKTERTYSKRNPCVTKSTVTLDDECKAKSYSANLLKSVTSDEAAGDLSETEKSKIYSFVGEDCFSDRVLKSATKKTSRTKLKKVKSSVTLDDETKAKSCADKRTLLKSVTSDICETEKNRKCSLVDEDCFSNRVLNSDAKKTSNVKLTKVKSSSCSEFTLERHKHREQNISLEDRMACLSLSSAAKNQPKSTSSKVSGCRSKEQGVTKVNRNKAVNKHYFYKNKSIDEKIIAIQCALKNLKYFPIFPVYSNLCKALAILLLLKDHKNEADEMNSKMTAAYYLAESNANSLRYSQILKLSLLDDKNSLTVEKMQLLFGIKTDDITPEDIIQKMTECLPDNYTVVQLSEAPDFCYDRKDTKHSPKLILCCYKKNSLTHTQLSVFGINNAKKFSSNIQKDFKELLCRNKSSMTISNAKSWWITRGELNVSMKEIITNLETLLGCFKGFLLGCSMDTERKNAVESAAKSLGAACNVDIEHLKNVVDSSEYLTDDELFTLISTLWKREESFAVKLFKDIRAIDLPSAVSRDPVILILDNNIQHFPWESMQYLQSSQLSRVPAYWFIDYLLLSGTCPNEIDSSNTFFLLNPTKDLVNTQKRFEQKFNTRTGWKGIIEREPLPEEFESALTNHDLFLYVGHGGGFRYLKRVEKSKFKATAILMGCSSGSLQQHIPNSEANGVVLKYNLSGCPCVVANLWDVTDADIDRLTEQFLQKWLPTYSSLTGENLASALNASRKSCKLVNLTGASPVIYGVPVKVQQIPRQR